MGQEGRGHLYRPADDSDDSDDEDKEKPPPQELMGQDIVWPDHGDTESDDDSVNDFGMDGSPPPDEDRRMYI